MSGCISPSPFTTEPTPEISHVSNPDNNGRKGHEPSSKQSLEVSQFSDTILQHHLGVLTGLQWGGRYGIGDEAGLLVDEREVVHRQGRGRRSIEPCDRVQNRNRFLLLALS